MNYRKETDLYNIIKLCYSEDSGLIEKWHIVSGTGLENCVLDTEKVLREDNGSFLVVQKDNELVGYFGESINSGFPFLSTIFVRPKYRKKEYMIEFWDLIKKYFNNEHFITGVYKKNVPANKFYEKHCLNKQDLISNNKEVSVYLF
jgi:hypothetical protein